MRTTMRGFYALRALAVLAAQTAPARPLALRKIAEEEGISMEFLQQIFFRLRKAGLIAASRGPGGGFYLARPAEKISVLEALDAAGECLALVPRDGEKGKGGENPDSGEIGDLSFKFWYEMEKVMKDYAKSLSLADISKASVPKENGRCEDSA